ncbi:hypothetical protein ATY79_19295 [Rhizobium sp. R693]|nr:hypothetical protein ATY79_19295 [Rhizobium sp. R693]
MPSEIEQNSVFFDVTLERGERLISHGSGGGGFGEPANRDQALIARSLKDELLTVAGARMMYGAGAPIISETEYKTERLAGAGAR